MWADLEANADRLMFLQGRIRLPLQDRQAAQLHSPQTSRSRSDCSRASFPQGGPATLSLLHPRTGLLSRDSAELSCFQH